jgi:hypothetical protein
MRPFLPLLGREIWVVNPGFTMPTVRLAMSYWISNGVVSFSEVRANSGKSTDV